MIYTNEQKKMINDFIKNNLLNLDEESNIIFKSDVHSACKRLLCTKFGEIKNSIGIKFRFKYEGNCSDLTIFKNIECGDHFVTSLDISRTSIPVSVFNDDAEVIIIEE